MSLGAPYDGRRPKAKHGDGQGLRRSAPITLKTYAPDADIKPTVLRTIRLADGITQPAMENPPPNHITMRRKATYPQVVLRSPAPPTLDALLRPNFVTAPDLHNLLPNESQHARVPKCTTPSGSHQTTSNGKPTGYDQHLSKDLQLRLVAQLPPGTMERIIRRWRELVRHAKDNIPTTEPWPDTIGIWAGTSNMASGEMSDEIGMQTTFMSLYKPILEGVVGRLILAAVTEGTPVDFEGNPHDWTAQMLPNLPVVTIEQKGTRATGDMDIADYRSLADNRIPTTADNMITLGYPHESSILLKQGEHKFVRWSFRDELYDPSRRPLVVGEDKAPTDVIGAATTFLDNGRSAAVPEARRSKKCNKDPSGNSFPPDDDRREPVEDDRRWRACHGLLQMAKLFLNEDTDDMSKVTHEQLSELIGHHQPPAPTGALLSDDIDHVRQMWREMVATGTMFVIFTDLLTEFRIGLRDPESHTLYLSPNYLPLLHRLPPNTLRPVGEGFEMEVCEKGDIIAWIIENVKAMPKQAYLDEPEQDGNPTHLFEIVAAITYEAIQLRLIQEEAHGLAPSAVPRTTEANIERLKRAFVIVEKPEKEDLDDFALSNAKKVDALVKDRRKFLEKSREGLLRIYHDIKTKSDKQAAERGPDNATRPPSPGGGHPGRNGGADPHEDNADGGGQRGGEGSTGLAPGPGNVHGLGHLGRQLSACHESQVIEDICDKSTPFAQHLDRVATMAARFTQMALTIHDGHLLASPEPAVFERVDVPHDRLVAAAPSPPRVLVREPAPPPLPPLMKAAKSLSSGSSSQGTESSRLSTCSTPPTSPDGSPPMAYGAFQVGRLEGHKTIAIESETAERPADKASYSTSVLCLDARVRLGGNKDNHVWGALACLGDGVQHGADLLAVKLALTPRGCKDLENEAAVYAHLAQSPLGYTLSERVKIPRYYGLFREMRDGEDSMLALVTSWELGARAVDTDDCDLEHLRIGVEALHTCGVCHQDLAPRNVLLTEDGQMTIIDFGRADITDDESSRREDSNAIETEF